jgi:hypothetical protein
MNFITLMIGKVELNDVKTVSNTFKFEPGSISCISDSQGYHTCIVINKFESQSEVLMITSVPNWNPYSRKMNSDEQDYVSNWIKRTSWFAPVLIKNNLISNRTYGSLPEYRLLELQVEFSGKFLS